MTEYRLLKEFRALFEGKEYRHRSSNRGDWVAMHLYEDLMALNRSARYVLSVKSMKSVVNSANKRKGVEARRGDGTFGELIPGETAVFDPGYLVGRGPIATVEIGVEVKILQKAMIKQIDRVKNDLRNQVTEFRKKAGSRNPICVGIVGINYADYAVGYEGDRLHRTTGSGGDRHPIQEADAARDRLKEIEPYYNEFLVLKHRATNEAPYKFEWVNEVDTRQLYASSLVRISNEYEGRF